MADDNMTDEANFQSVLDSFLRTQLQTPPPPPSDVAMAMDPRVEEIIYQYSRNQLRYHENMSLAFGSIFEKPDAPPRSTASPTTASPTTTSPTTASTTTASTATSGTSRQRRRSENENTALLVSYFFRHPVASPLLQQQQQGDPPHLVIGGDVIARYANAAAEMDPVRRQDAIDREVRQFAYTADVSSSEAEAEECVCGISQELFVEGDDVAEIRFCRHKFKPPLLMEWLRRSLTCPNCRHVLSAGDDGVHESAAAAQAAAAAAAAAAVAAVVDDPVFISLD